MAYLFSGTSAGHGSIDGCGHSCRSSSCGSPFDSPGVYNPSVQFGSGSCSSCGPSCDCGPCKAKYGGLAEWYIKEEDDTNDQQQSPPVANKTAQSEAGMGRLGRYGVPPYGSYTGRYSGSFGLAPAIAIPAVPIISAAAVLEAIALVLSALAAAYLLIKAYEAARDRGFGVALAAQALSAGLEALINAGRRMTEGLRKILEKAKRYGNRDPRCREAIERLIRTLGEILRTLAELEAAKNQTVPSVPELRRLMRQLGNWMNLAKSEVAFLIQTCGPVMTR